MSKYSVKHSNPTSYPSSSNRSQTSTLSVSSFNQHDSDEDDYVMVVSRRKSNYNQSSNSSDQEEEAVRLHKDLRIVQYDLVLVTCLMKELNTVEILQRNCYFGRFGQISKIIIGPKREQSLDNQVFITFKSQLDAAWAIAALKDFKHHYNRTVKIHYGASRYCSRFIDGLECKLSGCYFNHSLRENHLHMNQLKKSIDSQYKRAFELISDNLEYFVEKQYKQFKNKLALHAPVQCTCTKMPTKVSFPTCKEVIQKLIKQGHISSREYERVKMKIKNSHLAAKNRKTSEKQSRDFNSISQVITDQQFKQRKSMSSIQFRKKQSNPQIYCAQSVNEYLKSSFGMKDYQLVEQQVKGMKNFGGEKVSDLLSVSSCNSIGINPQMEVSQYIIKKIMNKRLQYCSRLSFALSVDQKTQNESAVKVKNILLKLIDL